jgi:chaperonin GroEL (HSP60 family)
MMLEMKNLHKKGNKYAGINVFNGKVEDMFKNNVLEPLRLGTHEIQTATEAATMILRIDDVIASKSSKSPPMPPGGAGGSGDFDEY